MLLLLAAGCPEAKPECDTGAWCGYAGEEDSAAPDTAEDPGTTTWIDTGTGTTRWYDSGAAAELYFVGFLDFGVTTPGEVAGNFGFAYYSQDRRDFVCWYVVTLPFEAPAVGCPGCEYAFETLPADSRLGEVMLGDSCEAFGVASGMFDGMLDYTWAYASTYETSYGTVERAILFDYGGYWFPVAWDEPVGSVTGYGYDWVNFAFPTGRYYWYYRKYYD